MPLHLSFPCPTHPALHSWEAVLVVNWLYSFFFLTARIDWMFYSSIWFASNWGHRNAVSQGNLLNLKLKNGVSYMCLYIEQTSTYSTLWQVFHDTILLLCPEKTTQMSKFPLSCCDVVSWIKGQPSPGMKLSPYIQMNIKHVFCRPSVGRNESQPAGPCTTSPPFPPHHPHSSSSLLILSGAFQGHWIREVVL